MGDQDFLVKMEGGGGGCQHLKQKFCLCGSVDHCDHDPGSQANFYGGHKFTILIWPVFFHKGPFTLDV